MTKIICLSFLLNITAMALECRTSYTDKAPFYITDTSINENENFFMGMSKEKTIYKDGKTHTTPATPILSTIKASTNRTKDVLLTEIVFNSAANPTGKFIKKGTLVYRENTVPFSSYKPTDMIKITVLDSKYSSTDNIINLDSNNLLKNKGDQGFLAKSSLEMINNNSILVLKKDTYLFNFTGGNKGLKINSGDAISIVMSSNKYKINICKDLSGNTTIHYLYKILSNNKIVQVEEQMNKCLELDYHQATAYKKINSFIDLMNNLYKETFSYKDFEYNEWGLVNLPSIIVNPETREVVSISHDETYAHYKGGDPLHSDTWGNPDTICEFMKLSQNWNNYCQNTLGYSSERCTIQVGDISWFTPGIKDNGKDPLGHLHHHDGTCIDIRPMRSDDQHIGTHIKYDTSGYDSNLTGNLIDYIKKHNGSSIFFNDSHLLTNASETCDLEHPKNELHKVKRCQGHDNHIHFCFKPKDIQGCESH